MKEHRIEGVGIFLCRGEYWECVPEAIPTTRFEIDTSEIHPSQAARAQTLVATWTIAVEKCLQFIERQRSVCVFESRVFTEPTVIIGVNDWIMFFTTEVEFEAVFGVEMRGDEPFQLVIGD